jgi:paired amphipathic helix protein Sin3a
MMPGGQQFHQSGPPAPPPQQQQQQQQQQQKMELHDAFAYLDRVKAEFADQPDVYNRFLQIMREFKANA